MIIFNIIIYIVFRVMSFYVYCLYLSFMKCLREYYFEFNVLYYYILA